MKKLVLALLVAAALISCSQAPEEISWRNPLTYSDIPDMDLIRVGEDYYMVSTTMYFCPGAPIMHSRDLVHWSIVNYVFDVIEDDDIYNMRDGKEAYGRGQWATSLRYVDGTYYALFIANDQRDKTYIYKTDDIVGGTWEKTVIPRTMHDASMLFDNDGRLYVVYGNGDLRILELEPDASAIKEGGVDQLLISSPREGMMLRAEGAHIYHIGDWYYILEIDWPFGGVRTETCWRSKELLGEYESKVVLQGNYDERPDGVAQGGIVETPDGQWFALMFQDHGAVGRIPTLQRVTWVDDWPILGADGVPELNFAQTLPLKGEDFVWASDEFDSDELALVWQWNHKPIDSCWSLTDRPGWLRLTTGQLADNVMNARNTLTQRTFGPKCTSIVKLDVSGMLPGDHSGLCAFQSNNFCIGARAEEDGNKYLEVIEIAPVQDRQNPLRTWSDSTAVSIPFAEAGLKDSDLWLRIDYDFDTDTAVFAYSADGESWNYEGGELQMRYTLDLFTGYRSAIYNYATKTLGGHVDVECFKQF